MESMEEPEKAKIKEKMKTIETIEGIERMERIGANLSMPIGGYTYYITFFNNLGHTKSWSACRHNHSETEVQFILCGECSILLGDTPTKVKAGDVLMIAPQVYHAPASAGPSTDFEKYSFLFSYAKTSRGKSAINAGDADGFAASFNSIENFRIFEDRFGCAAAFRDVIKEFIEMQPGYFTRIVCIMTGIIVLLSRGASERKMPAPPLPCESIDENRTVAIEQFFDCGHSFTRTQKNLADSLGISCRHLERIIKKTYNKSFSEKLQQSRMEVAADLLAKTDSSVSFIASQLGYSTEAGFYRQFNHYFKSTPTAFRKKLRSR